jgi:hypothetical protein
VILVVFAALLILSVPLTGGHLGRLAHVRVRGLWFAVLAIGVQIIITAVATGGSHALHSALHVVSYVFAGLFLWTNRRLPGIGLISLGAGMNALAIVANSGVMPASATAQRIAGLHLGPGFQNSAHLVHAHLAWLGDIIPFPGPMPLANVLSVGDLVLYTGMAVLLHRICRRPAVSEAPAPAAAWPSVVERPVLTALTAPSAPSLVPAAAPRPRRGSHPALASLGIGLAGFVVAVGVGSLVAARER